MDVYGCLLRIRQNHDDVSYVSKIGAVKTGSFNQLTRSMTCFFRDTSPSLQKVSDRVQQIAGKWH